jgi:hypothetical protein
MLDYGTQASWLYASAKISMKLKLLLIIGLTALSVFAQSPKLDCDHAIGSGVSELQVGQTMTCVYTVFTPAVPTSTVVSPYQLTNGTNTTAQFVLSPQPTSGSVSETQLQVGGGLWKIRVTAVPGLVLPAGATAVQFTVTRTQ